MNSLIRSTLAALLSFCLLPFFLFSDSFWQRDELENSFKTCNAEKRRLEIEFETTVEVSAECTYPYFHGDTNFIKYVNNKLQWDAENTFNQFVDHEKSSKEEYDKDFGGCLLAYELFPVCRLPKLISIYGIESQHRASPHGWTNYAGKNFWEREGGITEITLKDLFLDWRNWSHFLLKYCDHYFRSRRYGYYGSKEKCIPKLAKKDLDIFVITEKALVIIFRSYTVNGWADGPDMVAIPYSDLIEFIDPTGPLIEVPGILDTLNNRNI